MTSAPSRSSTAAVVVTRDPEGDVVDRVRSIAALADRTLVVDNGTRTAARTELETMESEPGVELRWNDENLGVARALNQGCAWAAGHGYGWVLLFDQDSRPSPALRERMEAILAGHPGRERVAVVGARHRDPTSLRTTHAAIVRAGVSWDEVRTVITSGSLLSLDAYRAVGPFRDDFFVDEVDHEFCLRARARGYSILLTREVLLEHGPGRVTRERLAGRVVHPTHHAPSRWYYMTRNFVVTARTYFGREPAWVLASIGHRLKMTVKMLLFEDSRRAKLACAVRGLADGLRDRLGPLQGGNG